MLWKCNAKIKGCGFMLETELRNPFGLRDNRIILIKDIPVNQNGLKCNCVCPACKEPFIAKMGNVLVHHFAHSGKGCDATRSYMTGLYMLLQEFLETKNPLYIPPVIVAFELSPYYCINENNIQSHTKLLSRSIDDKQEILLYEESRMIFDSTQILNNKDCMSQVIIAEKSGKQLDIRITPPDAICKIGTVYKYKNLPTLEINLSSDGTNIQLSNKENIFNYLISNKLIYNWIYNPKVRRVYPQIIKRSKAYFDSAQNKIKEAKRQAELRAEQHRLENIELQKKIAEMKKVNYIIHQQELEKQKSIDEENAKKERDKKYNVGLAEVEKLFTQQSKPIRDSYGIRWIQCEKCKEIKPSNQFVYYGGNNHANLGLCNKCSSEHKKF